MRQSLINKLSAIALAAVMLGVLASGLTAHAIKTNSFAVPSAEFNQFPNYTLLPSSTRYAGPRLSSNISMVMPPKATCPPIGFNANAPNLLTNAGFEKPGPRGRTASFSGINGGDDTRSAAAGWTMHTSNDRAAVTTELVRTTRAGGGNSMLHVVAGSNEGGVYQLFDRDDHGPERVVASVWVYVNSGRVVLATGNEGVTPTYSLSTTTGQWEQLQACSDGKTTNNWFVVYSTAVEGSDFFVDIAKVSEVRPNAGQCGGMMIESVVPTVTFPGGTIAINGRNFGNVQGLKLPAISRGNIERLQVTRWTDTQILARSPLDIVGGNYRLLIYCDNTFRSSSNSIELTVRDDMHRPR